MLRHAVLVGLMTVTSAASADACQPISKLIATLRPHPVEVTRMRELLAITLRGLSERAERVVEGQVTPVKTYLSDDGCFLLTDFSITISHTIAGPPALPTQPGPPLVFTQFGGEDTIDGVKVVVQDKEMPLLRAGQQVIVFLSRSAETKKWELAGLGGAFEVHDSKVVSLLRETTVQDMPADRATFVSRVRELHARRR